MDLLTPEIEQKISRDILSVSLQGKYAAALENIGEVLQALYANIPENRRISYGRVHTIKILAEILHTQYIQADARVFEIASHLYTAGEESLSTGVALGILSYCGLTDYAPVLPFFEAAAAASDWNLREFAQMFFRRLIKRHPTQMQQFLLKLVDSEAANLRRFVGETLRPVQENAWFYSNPEYPLTVLRHLFRERAAYPRTSVGNNLSDLARRLPDLVYDLVGQLVANGDKNSYWIAYRACRNLVKKEPIKVMDLLQVDEYRYKTARYKRGDKPK